MAINLDCSIGEYDFDRNDRQAIEEGIESQVWEFGPIRGGCMAAKEGGLTVP
jgi:hypothetical protein